MKRGDIINIDQLMQDTDGGRTIFEEEIGFIPKKAINSPLRQDKHPSFTVFLGDDGFWKYKDFSTGEYGNAIDFVKRRYNLSFKDTLKKIRDNIPLIPKVAKTSYKVTKKAKLDIEWKDMPFSDRHKRYFDQFELDESFLKTMDIYALDKYAINGRIVKIPSEWFQVCYFAYDINEIKVLRLGENVPKEEKWKSYNIPNDYIWYYYKYKDGCCNDLFVCKSNKDCAVMSKLGYCGISVQNEDASTLIKNKDKIEKICKNPYIVFGSDKQGKQASLDANKVLNWRYFNTKNYLLKEGVNDPASLVEFASSEVLDKEIKKAMLKWKTN